MKYNNLGNTGLLVSEICFGAMTFGGRGMWTAIGQQPQKEKSKPKPYGPPIFLGKHPGIPFSVF